MPVSAPGTSIVLFSRDLRLHDNPVLAAAASGPVVPLYVDDPRLPIGRRQRSALLTALGELAATLHDRGVELCVRRGDLVAQCRAVALASGATTVHVADPVDRTWRSLLDELRGALRLDGVTVVTHDSLTVVATTALPKPYVVFTPYYRRWLATPWRAPAPTPRHLHGPSVDGDALEPASGEFRAGERDAREAMFDWLARVDQYEAARDLATDGATSRLSMHLALGTLSPHELASRAAAVTGGDPFVRQLCWRDFFAQLLVARPELEDTDLRPANGWVDDDDAFAAWCRGETGYPIVDASMRQLAAEGFMANRNRMVVASFLTKDLGIDWRRGARHFRDHLVDFDVASNQLSWQWVAGTGTDTNPHRILSPVRQRAVCDPDGRYVAQWLGPDDVARPVLVDHVAAVAAWRAWRRGGSTPQRGIVAPTLPGLGTTTPH